MSGCYSLASPSCNTTIGVLYFCSQENWFAVRVVCQGAIYRCNIRYSGETGIQGFTRVIGKKVSKEFSFGLVGMLFCLHSFHTILYDFPNRSGLVGYWDHLTKHLLSERIHFTVPNLTSYVISLPSLALGFFCTAWKKISFVL